MLEFSYKDQYARVQRLLKRIEFDNRGSLNYDDDLWCFFQNCWHLKDWIKNDVNVAPKLRNKIEADVMDCKNIMICADLANVTKHLALSKTPRVGIDVVGRSATVNLDDVSKNTCEHLIKLADGSLVTAKQVAKDAMAEWDKIIATII